jgi:hypothetical protein
MRFVVLAVSILFALACGAQSRRTETPVELMTLSEARALEIIHEVLAEASVPRGALWEVGLDGQHTLDVDVRFASSSFGIEWMSPQDRADMGELVPMPAPGGQLRIVPGTGDDDGAQVLILEHSSYEYANDREAVQRGTPGASETEGRLRMDVRDFLEYVRGQGGV